MGIEFDQRQLQAIQVEANTVVRAGAGSGKTAVLSERFLWLLRTRRARIEEILALTFTQKAAAEMYQRIYERLREEPGSEEHLRRFDQAQISTLDSFCALIAREAAGRFGLPPALRYDEEAVLRLAEDLSLEFLLEHSNEPALAELLRRFDFQTLWRELFVSLAVGQFHLAGQEPLPAAAERQLASCRRALEEGWRQARSPIAELLELEPRTSTIAANQEALRALDRLDGLIAAQSFDEAAALAGGCTLKKPGGKAAPDVARMKQLVDLIRAALAELKLIASTLAESETLRGLFGLLERFRLRFLERKRALGLVTFRDVAEMAVEALRRDPSLRRHYQRRFRYILIDEFQDNNRLQKNLLYLLAAREGAGGDALPEEQDLEPDKLFFVGDEKQSIYRFRGADVSVFASLHEGLQRAGGKSLVLDRNYRSLPGLIRFFNRLFARVLAGARQDFEARFQEMVPPERLSPEASSLTAEVHVLVGLRPEPDAGPVDPGADEPASSSEAEALAVARWIREAVDSRRLKVLDGAAARPVEFPDIAILLRSTGNQMQFERMLRRLDIPYSTPNVRSLFLEAPAADLYLALRLALHPEDRSAYVGFLRSPFVNLSDDALLHLLLRRTEEPFAGGEDLDLPETERRKLSQGREVYNFLREQADRLSSSELIHRLWYEYGYRYFILRQPSLHNYLEFYDYLMALAERSDRQGGSLAGFLELLRENMGQFRRLEELEPPVRPAAGVQLLTIHKAKGLEFPVVIVADMANRGRSASSLQPYYLSDEFGITLNLGQGNYFSSLGERETEAKELAEARRLLYVAATRARCHLVLAGSLRRQNSEQAHLPMVLSALDLEPDTMFQGAFEPIEGCQVSIEPIPQVSRRELESLRPPHPPARPPEPDLERIASFYERVPLKRTVRRREYSVSELCAALEPEPGRGEPVFEPALAVDRLLGEHELESRFGSLVHELLARWMADPEGPCPQPDWRRLGIAPEHRQSCLEAAAELARGFLASPLGLLARRDPDRQTELPFLYRWPTEGGPLFISGQMDLVFRGEGATWLLDYKTDRSIREGQYDLQLAFYELACAELADGPVQPRIFLLRSGRAVQPARRPPLEELLRGLVL